MCALVADAWVGCPFAVLFAELALLCRGRCGSQKLEKLERRTQRAMVELAAKEEENRMRASGLTAS